MTDSEKAKLLLDLVEASTFPGSQRKTVNEICEWLESIRDGKVVVRGETRNVSDFIE